MPADSMMSKTVAIVAAFYPPHMGGVENYVANLSRQLRRDGLNVVVITSALNGRAGIEDEGGVLVYRLPSFMLMGDRFPLLKRDAEFRAMKHSLLEINFDYVLVNTRFYSISLFGLKLAKAKNVPAIVLEHGSAYLTLNNRILDIVLHVYEFGMTFLVKRFHPKFYAVSNKSSEWLKTFGIDCCGTLNNAVDPNALRSSSSGRDFRSDFGMKDDDLLVVYTGRMFLEKGVVPLASAIDRLNRSTEGESIHVAFAGDGPASSHVESFASKNIHILGRLNRGDIAALLEDSDILCLPTNSEGFPTSALEAAAYGLGIVITDTGGTEELIPNEDFGIVLGDVTVESIQEAILRFANDRDYLQFASNNVKERVEALFTWEKVAKRFEDVIR